MRAVGSGWCGSCPNRKGSAVLGAALWSSLSFGGQTFQKQKVPQPIANPSGHQSGSPIRPSQARKMKLPPRQVRNSQETAGGGGELKRGTPP